MAELFHITTALAAYRGQPTPPEPTTITELLQLLANLEAQLIISFDSIQLPVDEAPEK